ncbi:MAG: RNA polymerase sigma factor [Desulfitobacteriaceae bacterium]
MDTGLSFEDIYEELFPSIYRFVRVRIPKSDVEDVAAEIMVKVWRALPSFRGLSLKPWALRIAYHHIADYYRNHKRVPKVIPLEEMSLGSDHSEQWLTLLSVSQALAKLSPNHVTVIQLRLVEGLSASETAGILGITREAVDSLLYRAKKSFRILYQGFGTAGGGQI